MADNNIEIQASLKVDAGDSKKRIDEINQSISESKKALSQSTYGTKEYSEAQKALSASSADLAKAQKTLTSSAPNEAFANLKERVQGLVPGLASAEGGVKSFGTQLKLLAANPIILALTLIVAALGLIYEAFKTTRDGADKLEQVFSGVEATLKVVENAVLGFGRAVIDVYKAVFDFFTFDFKGAAENIKKANGEAAASYEGITKGAKAAFSAAVALKKERQELDRQMEETARKHTIAKEHLADIKEQLADENVGVKEKLRLAKELVDKTKELSSEERVNAKSNLDISVKEIALKYGFEAKKAQEVADLQIELLNDTTEATRKATREKIDAILDMSTNSIQAGKDIADAINKQHEVNRATAKDDMQAEKAQKIARQQVKSADAAANKASEDAQKERIANLRDFTLKDLKYKQELELAAISDAKKREFKIIENALQSEINANKLAVEQNKLTKAQALILDTDSLNVANQKKATLQKKFDDEKEKKDKEAKDKEADATRKFEAELNKIQLEIKLAGITDIREKEREQLKISFTDKFNQAEEAYKNDIEKLGQIRTQLFNQQHAAEKSLQKKFDDEDTAARETLSLKKIAFDFKEAKNNLAAQSKLLDQKQALIKAQYERELAAAGDNAIKKAQIEEKYTEDVATYKDARTKIADEELAHKEAMAKSIMSIASVVTDAIGKNTVVGKGVAVAGAFIDTYSAIVKQLKVASGSPGAAIPGYAIAQAIATGVAGLATVQKIISVNVPGGGGGSGGGSAGSLPSAPLTPQRASTSLDAASIQGVGNAASTGTGQVFVLDRSITDSQERQALLTRSARLH